VIDCIAALGRWGLGTFRRLGRGHLFLLQTLLALPQLLSRPRLVVTQLHGHC